jgi:hypothetical protein
MGPWSIGWGGFSAFDAVFHAIAGAFENNGAAVVKDTVEHGGGDGGVAVEDGGPLLEGFVGGQDDGTAFVTCTDDLEEQDGSALVDGQVADFIKDEQWLVGVFAQFGFEGAFGLGGVEGVDDVDGVGEEDAEALLAGGVRSTLMVHDAAIIDFQYADNLKQSKGIYILTA